ncbi:GNAT family N-acetyltransferase [Pseudodesulfovibrio cashew]|uniref:GNAT family N-acetyltransferase n=1 Tax=Pseudodesulfovibrio cashew TaxID=2678688 RepID=A0A6I6J9R2_9BACT|nr:GNAT family N-acetyltransferase [Pseudodesulfovibrio cashew]QGY39546.1 GNAT family N-acetyltransferase [Pseudodesulfovibrio cashew]
MDNLISEAVDSREVREIRIVSGLTPDDVEAILEMAGNSGLFSSDALMAAEDMAWDSAYGDGREAHTFLQAVTGEEDGARTVGFICFGPIAHWTGDYEMYGIAVDGEFQRLGIGTALVLEMKRQIAANGGKGIFLETGMDRAYENARLFYEANDFVQEHRFCKQFIPNDGGVVYRFGVEAEEISQYQ